ncbi:pyridine nucleotide-disulfide oxidoreductase [Enterococcus sp. DIV0418]|uniref:NAD(P)/FAD-dependent oxidoreductase n=1 Tax=Enterococcus sp. DIV0418 TaxID=2774732 RepID=UPI003F1EA331
MENKEVIIIGAGAAGVGMGVALKDFGINNFAILERKQLGNSFIKWPEETRFITPSFTSNGFGMPDLNAIAIDTSPSYTLGKERLSGKDYAKYLQLVSEEYKLPIKANCKVQSIKKEKTGYLLETTKGFIHAEYIIFAMGEFSFPNKSSIKGAYKNSLHYGEINSWIEIKGDKQTIIGGNESAIDAAIELAKLGKRVTIYTDTLGLNIRDADPSKRLSPRTIQRFFDLRVNQKKLDTIKIYTTIKVKKIDKTSTGYILTTENGRSLPVVNIPILCTGFKNGTKSITAPLFKYKENGEVLLNDFDESIIAKNIFLTGPNVRKGNTIFCYIYKFRQRFAVIANEIARRKHITIDEKKLSYYKNQSFYLDDCSECEVRCNC